MARGARPSFRLGPVRQKCRRTRGTALSICRHRLDRRKRSKRCGLCVGTVTRDLPVELARRRPWIHCTRDVWSDGWKEREDDRENAAHTHGLARTHAVSSSRATEDTRCHFWPVEFLEIDMYRTVRLVSLEHAAAILWAIHGLLR